MKFSYVFLCVGAALSNFSTFAATDSDKKAQDIEQIEVLGHKLTALNQDVASSVSVLSTEQIDRQQAADLNQILKTLPGVELSGSVAPLSGQPAIRGLYGERIYIIS
ncbi:Plug domain-containing protein [Pseudoalteromonas sp. S1727]|uniref:TonB-dependent receptor plug domain-containing protein n=1 Tax=Pseudoalteromonas sp. S1727 TaxID=2066514 RepID=UPI0020167CE4|nr:Plug domain-containing protein [Pseudoalteromonas sp. S1727]